MRDEKGDTESGESYLSDQLGGDIDHGGGEGPGWGNSLKRRGPGAEGKATQVREGQQLAARVADHPGPEEDRPLARTPRLVQAEPGRTEEAVREDRIGDQHRQAQTADTHHRSEHAAETYIADHHSGAGQSQNNGDQRRPAQDSPCRPRRRHRLVHGTKSAKPPGRIPRLDRASATDGEVRAARSPA